MRILCIDYGTKNIGIAVSDELGLIGHGLGTIERKSSAYVLERIKELSEQYSADRIVVGLPKNMNGSLGSSAQTVLEFVEFLKKKLTLPVVTWDERLSTMAAERVLIEADVSRRKRKKVIDKVAAAVILQGYLDSLNINHEK